MFYILKNKKIIPVDREDISIWGKWMQKSRDRIIKQQYIGKYFISTVFLGINYDLRSTDNNPLIFETMIFNQEEDDNDFYQERCRTYKEAVEQHKEAVKYIKETLKKYAKRNSNG